MTAYVSYGALELDLEVFTGPFDLLLALIIRDEVDLREVDLADIVLAYLDVLSQRGELDIEAATEFLVLIAVLLELKSRLILPEEEVEELEGLDPQEAASELLERMIAAQRYRHAGQFLRDIFAQQTGMFFRSAPLPKQFMARDIRELKAVYPAARLGRSIGALLRHPPQIDVRHIATPRVTVTERLGKLRALLQRGRCSFDEAVQGADRTTVAVTLVALLELYKQGEATWVQEQPFGEIIIDRIERLGSSPLTGSMERPETKAEAITNG